MLKWYLIALTFTMIYSANQLTFLVFLVSISKSGDTTIYGICQEHASMTTTQKTYLHIIQELESKDVDIIMRSLANLN